MASGRLADPFSFSFVICLCSSLTGRGFTTLDFSGTVFPFLPFMRVVTVLVLLEIVSKSTPDFSCRRFGEEFLVFARYFLTGGFFLVLGCSETFALGASSLKRGRFAGGLLALPLSLSFSSFTSLFLRLCLRVVATGDGGEARKTPSINWNIVEGGGVHTCVRVCI